MKYFDCWLRPIDKKEYARIQQRKELYEKGLGRVFVFLDVDGVLNINQTDAGWAEMNITPSNPYFDAAVMNVEYKDMSNKRSDSFKIFIYMADNSSVTMNGNNGNDNGYYGSGFWVSVTR